MTEKMKKIRKEIKGKSNNNKIRKLGTSNRSGIL